MELNPVEVRILISLERDKKQYTILSVLTRRLIAVGISKEEKRSALDALQKHGLITMDANKIPGIPGRAVTYIRLTKEGSRLAKQIKRGGRPM